MKSRWLVYKTDFSKGSPSTEIVAVHEDLQSAKKSLVIEFSSRESHGSSENESWNKDFSAFVDFENKVLYTISRNVDQKKKEGTSKDSNLNLNNNNNDEDLSPYQKEALGGTIPKKFKHDKSTMRSKRSDSREIREEENSLLPFGSSQPNEDSVLPFGANEKLIGQYKYLHEVQYDMQADE